MKVHDRRRHTWGPGRPRLTREQRAAIRVRRAADQAPYKVLAADFGISIVHAWRVCQTARPMKVIELATTKRAGGPQ